MKRPKKIYKVFGKIVCQYRTRLGMTQAELAVKVGLAREAIVIIEKGTYGNVNLYQLQMFAKAFDMNAHDLSETIFYNAL